MVCWLGLSATMRFELPSPLDSVESQRCQVKLRAQRHKTNSPNHALYEIFSQYVQEFTVNQWYFEFCGCLLLLSAHQSRAVVSQFYYALNRSVSLWMLTYCLLLLRRIQTVKELSDVSLCVWVKEKPSGLFCPLDLILVELWSICYWPIYLWTHFADYLFYLLPFSVHFSLSLSP